MKKEAVAGLIALLLVLSSSLVLYLFVARTTSGQKVAELSDTVRFLGERVDKLEEQRDLLEASASTLETEAEGLRKRVRQIDAELQNMRELLSAAGKRAGAGSFSWRRLKITTGGGLVIIAFLAFIWMLYSASKDEENESDSALPQGAEESREPGEPSPGSVLEEEFPPSGGEEPKEEAPPGEEPAGDSGEEEEPKEP
jgi:outer membrane murein-binding lipoprotein Lpp